MRFGLLLVFLAFCGAANGLGGADASTTSVALRWSDNSSNESLFKIERAEGLTAPFAFLSSVSANTTAFQDQTVVAGRTYRYRVAASNAAGDSAFSNVATVVVPQAGTLPNGVPSSLVAEPEGELLNVSARGVVTTGDATLIPGFVVGRGPVRALIRVLGPSWGSIFGIEGACADPVFEVRNQATGAVVATNDNWSGVDVTNATLDLNIFALPAGSKDAALVVLLPVGAYTVVARGVGGATGQVLAEVYRIP